MMKNHSMRIQCNIAPGTTIKGKWNKHNYTVIRELGSGANGIVYLADYNGKQVALKVSDNYAGIASEINVLQSFSKVQGFSLGPYLLHGDDWVSHRGTMPFYVMEYIRGEELLPFVKRKGKDWMEALLLQLLTHLEHLHSSGWVFGDLKPENLLVTMPAHQIRCVDVGGTTPTGRAIKEFTEFFDRGYWGMGSRKAEPSYDLFSVAMIVINVYHPNRFHKQPGKSGQLQTVIRQTPGLREYKEVLENALAGNYISAKQMRGDLLAVVRKRTGSASTVPAAKKTTRTRSGNRQKKKRNGFAETLFLVVLVCCLYGLYIYIHMLG
ncbi:serine/threonine-protein kinase [Bacillus testis]|uniref:serine/threonine-protein kinase n=1 Tax=Bacillus testis TaxID=1622072 RepID=UPI0028FCD6AF|nr:serine/threonine-protein kinase [Bacillus testis]